MSKFLTWNIYLRTEMPVTVSSKSVLVGEECGGGTTCFLQLPLEENSPIHHFCFILFLLWSSYYFATHCSRKNGSRAAAFSLFLIFIYFYFYV